MSGYDGEGTGIGGTDDGRDVADSSIGGYSGSGLSFGGTGLGLSASPGAGLSLAAPGGPGLTASASQFADFGPSASAPGLDFGTASAVQGAAAQLAMDDAARAAAKAATAAKTAATVKSGISLLPGGALLVAGVNVLGEVIDAIASAFSGSSSTPSSSQGTSSAPALFEGGDGPPDAGFTGGAPVLGFGGSVVNNAPQTTTTGSGVAPSLFPGLGAGYAPGGGLQYGAGFNVGAQPQQSAAPLLLLAAGASLFFMG